MKPFKRNQLRNMRVRRDRAAGYPIIEGPVKETQTSEKGQKPWGHSS